MALQQTRVIDIAEAVETISTRTTKLLADLERVLAINLHSGIDWNAPQKPAYIDEEVNGNIKDKKYTRNQVADAIVALDWIRKLLNNKPMAGSQGDHLGKLNQLADPR